MLFAQPSYYAQFTDTGGLNTGDKVRIAGMDVGTVQSLAIDGDHILMAFSTGSNSIGTESRLAIRTDTILGKRVVEIEPQGATPARSTECCHSVRPRRRIRSTTRSSTSTKAACGLGHQHRQASR